MALHQDHDTEYKKSSDFAYEIIRDQIISGEFKPGERLSLRRLAKRTGASNIPVMQALHRLETDGLVQTVPYVGSRVVELTESVIKDRCALRLAVESEVARILAKRMTDEEYHRFLEHATRIDSVDLADAADNSDYWHSHAEFHVNLARATGYESLSKALYGISMFELVGQAETTVYNKHLDVPVDRHSQLIEAIHSGNSEHAAQAARAHIALSNVVSFDDL